MTTYTVYRATNTINNKSYVGIDTNWPNARTTHEAARGDTEHFHRELRRYGPKLFKWEAVYETNSEKAATMMLFQLIRETIVPNGFNLRAEQEAIRTKMYEGVFDLGLNGTSAEDLVEVNDWINNKVTVTPVSQVKQGLDAEEEIKQAIAAEIKVDPKPIEKTPKKGAITNEGRKKISDAVSRPVSIDGIMYRSITEACEKLNLPRHQVKMILKGTNSVAYYSQKNAATQSGK
jgi:hypothetical protein